MKLGTIAKSSGIVLSLSFIATAIGYMLRVFLARTLSVSDYGLFYAILVFVGFFATFRELGLNTALVRFIPDFLAKNKPSNIKASIIFAATVQLFLGLLIVVPIIMFADKVAISYFGTYAATGPIQIIALSFFISILMSLLQSVFQGLSKMFYYAIVEPLRLSFIFIIYAYFISLGVIAAAYGYIIASIAVSAILFFLLLRTFPLLKIKAEVDKAIVKKMLLFSIPLFVGSLGSVAISYADTMILTLYRSLYEVGLYQVALPTSQLLGFFIAGICSVLLPVTSGLWSAGKKESISNGILILTKILFVVMIPIIIIFVAFPETILRILFSESFVNASQSLQILAAGSIFYSLYFMFGTVMISIGKPTIYTKLLFAVGVLSIMLNLTLVPVIGINGAALSTAISYVFGSFVAVLYTKKFIAIKFPVAGMLKAFSGGCITVAVIYVLKSSITMDSIPEVLALGITSVILYSLFSIRFILNKGDLKILSDIGIKLPKFLNSILAKAIK